MTNIAVIDPKEYGLVPEQVRPIEQAFMPKIVERDGLKKIYERIIVKELTPELCSEARELRLKLVKVRTGIADIHKTQKAYFLAAGRYVDAWKNKETLPVVQMEENLNAIEKHFENIEKAKKEALKAERITELAKYETDGSLINLGDMSDDIWNNYFSGVKLQYEKRKEEERKAEEARIAAEKAEAAERERIRLENEKMRKENERLEKEKKIAEEKAAAERKAAEAERLRLEKEKQAAIDKANKEREAAEEELRKQREEAAQKERDRIAAEEKAAADKLEAERKAILAPDKDKLLKLANDLIAMPLPEVSTGEAAAVIASTKELLTKTATYIREKAANM